MFYRWVSVLGICVFALAACAPEPTATPTLRAVAVSTRAEPTFAATPTLKSSQTRTPLPVATLSRAKTLTGKFVFAPGDGSLWTMDTGTGHAQVLFKPQGNQFADSPVFTPDGMQVIYTLQDLTAQGIARTSVYVVDVSGNNSHIIVKPPDIKTSLYWPAISPDGKWVYYTSAYPIPPNQEHTAIERVPVTGGTPQTVLESAQRPAIAPDGKHLAFLRFNYVTYGSSLWIADQDGQNPRQLMADDVFAAIATPFFSPDGQWLLFAASGPPTRQLPGALVHLHQCEPELLCQLAAPVYADGLPWDLWLASVDGKQFRQITKVGADSPAPAWSRDGLSVAFLDTNGIYLVDVQTHIVSRLSKNGGHGALSWWQPLN